MNRAKSIGNIFISLAVVILFTMFFTACGPGEKVSGTGVDSGNAFTVSGVIKQGGKAASGVEVTLYPAGFVPGRDLVADSMRATTDDRGGYLLKASGAGIYNIQAYHPQDSTTAIIRDIQLREDRRRFTAADAGLLVHGVLALYPEDVNYGIGSRLYIPGTGIYADADSFSLRAGLLVVSDVPQGSYPVLNHLPPENTAGTNILTEKVAVITKKITAPGGNVDSVLTGTWFSTDPKDWSFDTAYIAETGIRVPGLQVYGGLNFTARNGLMTDWRGKVAVEYLMENDTLYTEMILGSLSVPDGQVNKAAADGFVKILNTVPERYQ